MTIRNTVLLALAGLAWLQSPASVQAQAPDLLNERPCGPDSMTGPLRYLIPQGAAGADFRPSCRCHDKCYEDPNSTREQCDLKWRDQMFSACEGSRCRFKCRLVARFMYLGVKWFGEDAYAAAAAKRQTGQ